MYSLRKRCITILIDNRHALRYETRSPLGNGHFKHLADDYDLKCRAIRFDHNLPRKHNILVTYKNVYSHQYKPEKPMKLDPTRCLLEAACKACNPSTHTIINIAYNKEPGKGQQIFCELQTTNPIIPAEIGVVLEINWQQVFKRMKEETHYVAQAPNTNFQLAK